MVDPLVGHLNFLFPGRNERILQVKTDEFEFAGWIERREFSTVGLRPIFVTLADAIFDANFWLIAQL